MSNNDTSGPPGELAAEAVTPAGQPRWLIPVIVGAGLLAIFIVWWATGRETGDLAEPASVPQAATATLEATATLALTAQDAAAPPPPSVKPTGQASEPRQTSAATAVELPTVTPTAPLQDIEPRTVEIGGSATLRLTFANPNYESDGRPVLIEMEPRTYMFAGDSMAARDQWCVQLGLFNIQFDLLMEMDPASEELEVSGEVRLHDDFCDVPGLERDSEPIELAVPADASAQIGYSLYGERKLLGVSDLLDAQTSVIVELTLDNSLQ